MLTDVHETTRRIVIGCAIWPAVTCLVGTGCLQNAPDVRTDSAFVDPVSVSVEPESIGRQWPGWRGALLQGVSPCKNLPTRWNRREGILWRVDVPGQGNSSPVVWDDHVYLTSQFTDEGASRLVVFCFDRNDGQQLWQANLGSVFGPTHQKNGYASSTVATDGQHVAVFVGSRRLHCLDASGNELWRVEFPLRRHEWGLAASPLIFRNLVIQVCDGGPNSFVVAIDLETGREVWRTERASQGCWSTPVISEVSAGGKSHFELIVNGTSHANGSRGYVIAYNPTTGEPLWQTPCTTDIPCPTAIVAENMIVSSSGGNGPVVAIRPGGHGDVSESHVAWQHSHGGPYVPTGIAYRNRLFIVADSGRMTCYNLADGRPIWKKRLSGTFTASLVAGEGNIYATNERGEVYVIPAADHFELVTVNPLGERCLATPAIAHSHIFIRSEQSLFCIEGVNATHARLDESENPTARSMSDRDPDAAPLSEPAPDSN